MQYKNKIFQYPPLPILIVDDEPITLESLEFVLNSEGFNNLILCEDSRKVMDILQNNDVGIVLLDLLMPHVTGEELLVAISEKYPEIPVIIITCQNELDTAIQCIKSSAYEYLVKPVEEGRLISVIKRAVEIREMRTEINLLRKNMMSDTLQRPEVFSKVVTQNTEMFSIFQYIESVAKTSQPVLITGETGVGKELIAEAIHKSSNRKGIFNAISVGGLDDNMFADTLFGHKKGAYTDARDKREGMVEKSAGGTLFMDEIGELSPNSQIKLLRLLQEREYFPLGSDVPRQADVRILAATNRDLLDLAKGEKFRYDLFYRLNSHRVNLPPLGERLDDLPLLVDHFLTAASQELSKRKPTPPPELITLLSTYHFPGNVRELKSMIFDAVAIHQSRMLNLDFFKNYIRNHRENIGSDSGKKILQSHFNISGWKTLPTIKQITVMLVEEALKRTNGNKSIAAQTLGITRQTLSKYINEEIDNIF